MVADLEQVDKIDASEFHNVKLNAKEMISPKLVTIPKTADGQLKLIGGDQVLRTSTSIGVSVPRTRRSSRRPSWRIRRGFHQPPKQEVIAHQHSIFRNQ